jgi:hypothetical protein
MDIEVRGYALGHVASRARTGGLSALQIGPQSELMEAYARRNFWNIITVQVTGIGLLALGGFLLVLSWMNRKETFLLHFGLLIVGWALMSMRVWWSDLPLNGRTIEFAAVMVWSAMAALTVNFLLSHARTASKKVSGALLLQCAVVAASLLFTSPERLFTVASTWFVVMALEVSAAVVWYLKKLHQARSEDFWPMALTFGAMGGLFLLELALQSGLLRPLAIHPWSVFSPLLLLVIGSRLLLLFGRALQAAEINRAELEARVNAKRAAGVPQQELIKEIPHGWQRYVADLLAGKALPTNLGHPAMPRARGIFDHQAIFIDSGHGAIHRGTSPPIAVSAIASGFP